MKSTNLHRAYYYPFCAHKKGRPASVRVAVIFLQIEPFLNPVGGHIAEIHNRLAHGGLLGKDPLLVGHRNLQLEAGQLRGRDVLVLKILVEHGRHAVFDHVGLALGLLASLRKQVHFHIRIWGVGQIAARQTLGFVKLDVKGFRVLQSRNVDFANGLIGSSSNLVVLKAKLNLATTIGGHLSVVPLPQDGLLVQERVHVDVVAGRLDHGINGVANHLIQSRNLVNLGSTSIVHR